MLIAIAASRIENNAQVARPAHRAVSVTLDTSLDEARIAGRLSLIGRRPLSIAAVPGLVVHVRTGSLWATQHREERDHLVGAGERFVVDRPGPLVVSGLGNTELQIEWPLRGVGRLSPGLEPTASAA